MSDIQSTVDAVFESVARAEWNTVHQALARGIDVNARNSQGKSLLLETIRMLEPNGANSESEAVIEDLVSRGADVNVGDMVLCQFPLHEAVAKGARTVADFLLANHANANTTIRIESSDDFMGFDGTALHIAAAIGESELVTLLLRYGAQVDALGVAGETPLHQAAAQNQLSTAKTLLKNGANVNAQCSRAFGSSYKIGETPLHLAVHYLQPEMVELLLQCGANRQLRDADNMTPLDVLKNHKCRALVFSEIVEDDKRRIRLALER